MKFDADYLLGRRFMFESADVPDVTVIAVDVARNRIRLHATDGARQWLPFNAFVDGIKCGAVVESEAAPFVLDRETKFDRIRSALRIYVAGPHKRPMRGYREM